MKNILLSLTLLLASSHALADNQWVHGDVSQLEDYAGYANGQYEVLITLKNQSYKDPVSAVPIVLNDFASKWANKA
jgi:hypothetical protein